VSSVNLLAREVAAKIVFYGPGLSGKTTTLRKIYEEGRGTIKVQGEWKEEDLDRGRKQIVITSIPYGVDKGEL